MESRYTGIKEFLKIKETEDYKNDKDKFEKYLTQFSINGVAYEGFIQDVTEEQPEPNKFVLKVVILYKGINEDVIYNLERSCYASAECEFIDWSVVNCAYTIFNIAESNV